jgi:integrase
MTGKVRQRRWKARGLSGRRETRVAWGYTCQINGKQVKQFDGAWSQREAMDQLQARLKMAEAGQEPASPITFGAVAEQYLAHKQEQGKRSLREDRRIVGKRLLPYFGADTPITAITGPQVAQYERKRIGEVSAFTVCNELAVLKHLLRLARRWGYIKDLIDIELPKKPAHRERYLEAEEITRLLAACEDSKNPYLATIVTVALNTGCRKEEILKLAWPQINFSTATISLYKVKSGKPRGIPINGDLEAALQAHEPDPAKRQGLLFKKKDGRRWGQVRTRSRARSIGPASRSSGFTTCGIPSPRTSS